MTKLIDSRPQFPFVTGRDLDLTDRLPVDARLPGRDAVSGVSEAVVDGVVDAVDAVDWAEISDGLADAVDTIADAASVAGHRTSRLARRIGRSGAMVGAAGARGAVATASAAGRGIGSTARAARRNPKRTIALGALAVGAVAAIVLLRREHAADQGPEIGLARAA